MIHPSSQPVLNEAAALACRLVRTDSVTRPYLRWLSHPGGNPQTPGEKVFAPIRQAMEAILHPLSQYATAQELNETRHASVWLSAICQHVARRFPASSTELGLRLLAMACLPIYRSLGTGELHAGFQGTCQRMTEVLCLLAARDALSEPESDGQPASGEPFAIFEHRLCSHQSPAESLRQCFQLDIAQVAHCVRTNILDFDSQSGEFSPAACQRMLVGCGLKSQRVADWEEPNLLWHLAGELSAQKTQIVLPRPWIDAHVPWGSIIDHWSGLAEALTQFTTYANPAMFAIQDCIPSPPKIGLSPEADTPALSQGGSDGSRATFDPSSPTMQPVRKAGGYFGEPNALAASDLTHTLAPEAQEESRSVGILPRVLIADINSHRDSAFINVLKRQIAKGRADARTILLAKVVVQHDDASGREGIGGRRDNGLSCWQQHLVDLLGREENILDSYAFLTPPGELLLCTLGLERSEMAQRLRSGLIEVLTGQSAGDGGEVSLVRVNIPARFHVGIACAGSPSASFSPDQLIEPTLRCALAASRQGKAAIKSIEVF